jgi:hypothetical protein
MPQGALSKVCAEAPAESAISSAAAMILITGGFLLW